MRLVGLTDEFEVALAGLVRPAPQSLHAFLPNLSCEQGTKPTPPVSYRFMADINATLVQKTLYFSKRQLKSDVQQNSQADDLGTGF
ncbi:hypothetical protein ALP8811_01089 [Aliiroseovarius pelagivivens]|uniref:Uncharacterized protein n=1 Tax=Aliiroseovarius pelagivivens TaxID=1639690 RepID=A0A2R8AJL8_9RHOB|nr:hypothetical protein ALP8811_01089 [Aliiroseovarius pelagivivens]